MITTESFNHFEFEKLRRGLVATMTCCPCPRALYRERYGPSIFSCPDSWIALRRNAEKVTLRRLMMPSEVLFLPAVLLQRVVEKERQRAATLLHRRMVNERTWLGEVGKEITGWLRSNRLAKNIGKGEACAGGGVEGGTNQICGRRGYSRNE